MKRAVLSVVVGLSLLGALSARAECGGGNVGGTVGGFAVGKVLGGRGLSGLALGAAGAAVGNHMEKKHNQRECELQAQQAQAEMKVGAPATPIQEGTSAGLFVNQKGEQFKCYKEQGPAGTTVNVCINGETTINVDSAFVHYKVECFARNTYTAQVSPSPVGSPFSQSTLQEEALGICRGITPKGACVPTGCNYLD